MAYSPIVVNPKYPLILFVIFYCTGCAGKKNDVQWDEVRINPEIAKDSIYQQLDKQEEVLSAEDLLDTLTLHRRTSDVTYFSEQTKNIPIPPHSRINNCRAYFLPSANKLLINIGIADLHTSRGFTITYKDGKFFTKPYFEPDAIDEDAAEPIHKNIYQKLTLDKPEYTIGDSLYGNIDFQSFEIVESIDTIWHFGKGGFRAKIKRLPE